MDYTFGDPVIVSSPVGEEDRRHAGKRGTFVRYAKGTGFAVVNMGEEFTVQLHPESLEHDLPPTERAPAPCAEFPTDNPALARGPQ